MSRVMRAGAVLALIAAAAFGAAAVTGAAPAKKTKKVSVVDDLYLPDRVKIRKGDSVKWVWSPDAGNPHNVTKKKGPGGKFESIPSAVYPYAYKHRFRKRGRYKVYCTIHPGTMNMTVRVRR